MVKDGDQDNNKKFSGDGAKKTGYMGGKRDVDKSPDDSFKKKNRKGKMQFTDSNPFSILKTEK